MALTPVVLNGRFLGARSTGVQRVAGQLVGHLDRLLATEGADLRRAWRLDRPGGETDRIELANISQRHSGAFRSHAWEQLELPIEARGAVLVNLCNLAPLSHRLAVTLIHDAQVFLTPHSYSRAFVAWYQFALPRIGASAARVITVSEYSRDRLVEFGIARRANITVIHNGVDHLESVVSDSAVIDRLNLTPGRFVVAAASTMSHKNVGVLFKAFASPMLADLRLVLVGGAGREEFAKAGAVAPAGAIFTGRLPDSGLRGLYEHATCLAFPSRTEGFGLPPLEAMALGCPTVVAPCGALPETCGDAAIFADPDNPAEWARAIRALTDGADLRANLRGAGLARSTQFRWDNSARALLDVIETVASEADLRGRAT